MEALSTGALANAVFAQQEFHLHTIVMPEQDAVVAITSESSNMQGQMNLVWDYLLPAMSIYRLAVMTAELIIRRCLT